MQSQYLITKDENGNYIIANSQDGEKLCGLNCSGDDPCKNCDKCMKPQPVIAPTLIPEVPITSNPVILANFKNSISNPTPKSMFINEEGKLTTVSIVLIAVGVLLVFLAMYFMLKKYKKHRKFKRFHRNGDEPSVSYINGDFDDTNYDSVEDY
jgi:hypothetical protein